jgi:hypothetical protein
MRSIHHLILFPCCPVLVGRAGWLKGKRAPMFQRRIDLLSFKLVPDGQTRECNALLGLHLLFPTEVFFDPYTKVHYSSSSTLHFELGFPRPLKWSMARKFLRGFPLSQKKRKKLVESSSPSRPIGPRATSSELHSAYKCFNSENSPSTTATDVEVYETARCC